MPDSGLKGLLKEPSLVQASSGVLPDALTGLISRQERRGCPISFALGIQAKDSAQRVGVALAATRMNIGPNDEPEGARRAPLPEMLLLSAKTTLMGQPQGSCRRSHAHTERSYESNPTTSGTVETPPEVRLPAISLRVKGLSNGTLNRLTRPFPLPSLVQSRIFPSEKRNDNLSEDQDQSPDAERVR